MATFESMVSVDLTGGGMMARMDCREAAFAEECLSVEDILLYSFAFFVYILGEGEMACC